MSDLVAISASLVNMRNVGTHRSVALTIHVPEEMAQRVVDIFGWPTMSTPVPVAIARLKETPADIRAGQDGEASPLGVPEGSRPAASPSASRWGDMKPSKQAALRCKDRRFQEWMGALDDEDEAARQVRLYCCVRSRSEIDDSISATNRWRRLDADFLVQTGQLAEPR